MHRAAFLNSVKKGVAVLSILSTLITCGCTGTPAAPTEPATEPAPELQLESKLPQTVIAPVGEFVQQPAVRDWSYMWWKDGYHANSGNGQLNIQTGYYGLALHPAQGQILHLGAIAEELTQEEAALEDGSRIEALSVVDAMNYSITIDGQEKPLSGISVINSAVDRSGSDTAKSRIVDSGRYAQCMDMMNLEFQGEYTATGRVEVTALPRYLSVDFSLWESATAGRTADLCYSITLGESYTSIVTSDDGNVITATEDSGKGLTFLLPGAPNTMMIADEASRTITFTCKGLTLEANNFVGMNFVIIPSVAASLADADLYRNNQKAVYSAEQIYPKKGREQPVEFSPKGYLNISLNNMLTWYGPDFNEISRQDDMDRVLFTIENPTDQTIKVPVRFEKNNKLGVLGCCPMLRDAQTGEPIGVQVQLSKNWHATGDFQPNDPATYLGGTWFHGYTYIEVPAGETVSYEFCMTYAKWGGVYAASHSQLCLAGWGGNYQLWESSSIGSFGESFVYEPEITHGRGLITDIRALLTKSIYKDPNGNPYKYYWTENIGGGNFLFYSPEGYANSMFNYKKMHVQYRTQGPNLTEVIYRGITEDEKIAYEVTLHLPRTDDVSKAYHTFKYTFLEDVTFGRMAFYQFGTDNYNDNHFETMAVGNDAGTVDITLDGKTYSGDFKLPKDVLAQYVGGKGMQRIDVEGEGLWVAFMGYEPVLWKVSPGSNRMLNLISYNATLNGKTYKKPSLSFFHTMNGGVPCIAVELSPPAEVGNTIQAGSVVEGTVQWLNMPCEKEDYYGPSEIVNGFDEDDFNTSKIAYAYAVGSKYDVTAEIGTVVNHTPIKVACTPEQTSGAAVAQITVTGGMSWVPMTFTGVQHYSGYQLEQLVDGQWVKVDQSVSGNDYWQVYYDSTNCTYEFTYNVEHTGGNDAVYQYRLVKN